MRATGRDGIDRGWPRGPAGPVLRLAAVVVLLGLAALGTAARGITHLPAAGMLPGPARPAAAIAGVAAAAVCLVLTVVLLVQGRRTRPAGELSGAAEPVPWWGRVLAVFMFLVWLALAAAIVLIAFADLDRGRRPEGGPASVVPVLPHGPGRGHSPGTAGTAVLLLDVVLALVAGVVAVVVLWRRRRAAAAPRRAAGASPLAAAVAAGSSAFGATAGVREAIIACYAAMEDTLAAAGSPRRAADTPEELLDRAVRNGVIRTQAAYRLTVLFREARFSPHELGEAQRQAARASLAGISHDLSGAS